MRQGAEERERFQHYPVVRPLAEQVLHHAWSEREWEDEEEWERVSKIGSQSESERGG